jgi:phage/plasmid primase-like uncharacterized protein
MISAKLIEGAKAVRLEDELVRRGIGFKGRGPERSGPCLVCGGRDRFAINLRKQIWNCRGCRLGGDIVDLVQHIDGCSFADAVEILTGNVMGNPQPDYKLFENRGLNERRREQQERDDEQRRLELAHRLFEQAEPLGPDAISYFERRGIDIHAVPELGGLRWHPKCHFDGQTKPCIIGRYTTATGNEPRGIWRRPTDGSSKPKALGPTAGCVIRLWPDDRVTLGLVLGEGVETTLAAATRIEHRGTLLQPAWAAGSAQNMRAFPVLSGLDLTLLVDDDANGTGQQAANECAQRWLAHGREVIRLKPNIAGRDFNNIIQENA